MSGNFGPSKTQQQYKNQMDITQIVRRAKGQQKRIAEEKYLRKGFIADFTERTDFHQTLRRINEAKIKFNALPSQLKQALNQDPGMLIELVNMIEMGDQDAIDFAAKNGLIDDKYHSENIQKRKNLEKNKETLRGKILGAIEKMIDPENGEKE